MAPKGEHTTVEAAGHEIRISSPSKVYFPEQGGRAAITRLDLAEHYLRIDLDPMPGVARDDVRRVALAVDELLCEMHLRGYPKTSGSRGIHVNVRIEPQWSFLEVRRAALAPAREVERHGDPAADMDAHAGRLDGPLDLARRDEEGGLGDAPWPPHFARQAGEPRRVQPSRAKQASS